MAQNQTGQKQSALQSPSMLVWRLNRAEIERRENNVNRDLLHRQHEG